jgi:hypothetical protein
MSISLKKNDSPAPATTSRSKDKKMRHFPGDPRFGVALSAVDEDVTSLCERKMLSTRLLDFLIQQAAPPPTAHILDDSLANHVYLGSLGTQAYIQQSNRLLEDANLNARKIQRIRSTVDALVHDELQKTIVIPIIESCHFYVIVVGFAGSCRKFYNQVRCYDSLRHSGRAQMGMQAMTYPQSFLSEFNMYMTHFVLHDRKQLQQPTSHLWSLLEVLPCPQQRNGIDCGLFAVGVVLHLLANVHIDTETFKDHHISNLRKELAAYLSSAKGHKKRSIPSALVRNCFPCLKGTTIVGECGVEVLNSNSTTSTITSTTRHEREQRAKRTPTKRDSPTKKGRPLSTPESAAGSQISHDDVTMERSQISYDDVTMEELLKESKVHAFSSLDDVSPLVATYEQRTGNRLRIYRSEVNKFRLYKCSEHLNCTYQILFGRRRSDGWFTLKRVNNKHLGIRRSSRARDGRRWKERRVGKLNDVIVQVLKTKNDKPVPADIVKTAATRTNSEVIPYHVAYRALNTESSAVTQEEILGFQLLIPYLDRMKLANPGSLIGYTRNQDATMKELFFFPGFVDEVLQFVRPIISLDAAHLRSKHKGTLFVASVLSGANEVYPIGFMISAGNEDLVTWTSMLNALKKACPIISKDEEPDSRDQHVETGIDRSSLNSKYLKFVFISDRDKGLKAALKTVFPKNLEVSCAKHIEANVAQRFGLKCSQLVYRIAKTFSTRYENRLFETMRNTQPAAVRYLLDHMKDIRWRGTSWLDDELALPPRYGIVTSNTSESVNSMLSDARDVGWLQAVEKIVDIISTKIYRCRQKYKDCHAHGIVPIVAQVMKKRWDIAASLEVIELEEGLGQFKVVNTNYVASNDDDDVAHNSDDNALPLVSC